MPLLPKLTLPVYMHI